METYPTVRMLAFYIFANLKQRPVVYDRPRIAIRRAELHRHGPHPHERYCTRRVNQRPLLTVLRWSSRMHSIAPPPGGIWPRPR